MDSSSETACQAVPTANPLSAVEDFLGAGVETWPEDIVMYIFVEDPTMFSVKQVAAFMWGNKVPQVLAISCFTICNGGRTAFITEQMAEWYKAWSEFLPRKKRDTYYYSMWLRKVVWINGIKSVGDIDEGLTSRQKFGFGHLPNMLKSCVENVKQHHGNRRREQFRPMFV
jgi:hypothetical protein